MGDCGREDICKEERLYCRAGTPCEILCDAKATCSSGTILYADTATDVTLLCGAEDSCKDIRVSCGTGDCKLECDGSKSCIDWGSIDVSSSTSWQCIGNCPKNIPAQFSPIP